MLHPRRILIIGKSLSQEAGLPVLEEHLRLEETVELLTVQELVARTGVERGAAAQLSREHSTRGVRGQLLR